MTLRCLHVWLPAQGLLSMLAGIIALISKGCFTIKQPLRHVMQQQSVLELLDRVRWTLYVPSKLMWGKERHVDAARSS